MNNFINTLFCEMGELLTRKNADYNDAYHNACTKFKDYGVSKIYEKYMRIEQLSSNDNQVNGEGLKDALKDCIGYCALMLNEINEQEYYERVKKTGKVES